MEWTFESHEGSRSFRVFRRSFPADALIGYTHQIPYAQFVNAMIVDGNGGSPLPQRVLVSFSDGSTGEYVPGMASGSLQFTRWL